MVLSLFVFGASVLAQGDVDPNPRAGECVSINNNLRYRDRMSEVFTLQDYLQSNGYLNSEPTGFFGILTRQAVMDFQNANGITPASGYFGPISRAKAKMLTCGGTIPTPTPTPIPSPIPPTPSPNKPIPVPVPTPMPDGCFTGQNYSSTTGMPCVYQDVREQKFTGYLSPLGPTIQMWGTHTLSFEENIQCIMAPCNPIKKSYPVQGKDSKVSADLKLYENNRVTILGKLVWNNFEGGFYGIVASKVEGSTSTPIPIPMIKVLSPNGGETWAKDTKQTIKWQDNTSIPTCPEGAYCAPPAPKYYDINLMPYYPPCISNVCPAYPYISPYTIAKSVYGSSYSWSVGRYGYENAGGDAMINPSILVVPDGSYTVQVCQSGSGICDSSDFYFKIISSVDGCPLGQNYSSTTGQRCGSGLVISGVSGPQSLKVNETGTWTVKASDGSGGSLSYSVDWGDQVYYATNPSDMARPISIQQSATFTHKYSTSGTYQPTFFVTNSSGRGVKAGLSVNVGEIIEPYPSITVLSPNGGETWAKDTKQTIKWQDNMSIPACLEGGAYCALYVPVLKYYDISLMPYYSPCTTDICPLYSIPNLAPYTIATKVKGYDSSPASYVWGVGKITDGRVVPDGSYTVQVCQSGSTTCDSSDSYFKIVSSTLPVLCEYAAPPQGCAYTPGSNYNPITQCGLVLMCSGSGGGGSSQPANALNGWNSAVGSGQNTQANTSANISVGCGEFTTTLTKGVSSLEVKCLQRLLNEKGFNVAGVMPGQETTYFGEATREALIVFQRANGLVADGVFGPVSQAVLKK